MVIVGDYPPGNPLRKHGFDSHAMHELSTMSGGPQGVIRAHCDENKVSFGVKIPYFGICHHYLNCFSAALLNQMTGPSSLGLSYQCTPSKIRTES